MAYLRVDPRLWNLELDSTLKNMGFESCNSDECLYKGVIDESTVLIFIHVDDLGISAPTKEVTDKVVAMLRELTV